ncbi:MAG: hypothetical protein H0X33_06345 [Taibaiella sp.]|nr:hypothetical protein [Taibaiella sp.]
MRYFIVIMLVFLLSCKKNNIVTDGLPPITQNGRNTLAFLLNGNPFVYQDYASWNTPYGILIDNDPAEGPHFTIFGFNANNAKHKDDFTMCVRTSSPVVIGMKYYFTSIPFGQNQSGYVDYPINTSYGVPYTFDTTKSYIVFARYDTIVAGKFVAFGANSSIDTINISKGFFDIKL